MKILTVIIPCYNSEAYMKKAIDHVVVGEGAIVAAGAVVTSGTIIGAGELWAGVPAKFVKKVDPEQSRELNQRIARQYLMYASWYKE